MFIISGGLAFFENDRYFESFENLIFRVNEHAAIQGYAVVFGRTKKSKLRKKKKI